MAKTLCHEFADLPTPWGPIKLEQMGRDRFAVTYGKQVDSDLTYAQACTKLGQALMHWLSCADKVDNRMPGER
jgi:hypothetical protein